MLCSQYRLITHKSYFLRLIELITFVFVISLCENSYAQDCKTQIIQINLEIKELEFVVNKAQQDWEKLPQTSFAKELLYGIWDGNLRLLNAKKSVLSSLEAFCSNTTQGSVTNDNWTKVIDDEGEELEPTASLNVTKLANKYLIKVESNIARGSFLLIATKKGNKAIGFRVYTDESGNYTLRTSKNLKGFLLVLKYNEELLKETQVN